MLVTTKDMFEKSMREGFAIGAFNVNNMEIIQAIVDAAAEEKSPVILQASSSAIKYARINYLMKMVEAACEEHPEIPIAIHLDHGPDFETAKMCIDNGFTSVMIDGSKYSFEENARLTKQVVEYAHSKGVMVEAEIGKLAGVEDDVKVAEGDAIYTDPADAERFVKETGCETILNPLLGVWDNPRDIDWDLLPNKFVLKCNHGSGYNIICKDKETFDKDAAQKKLRKWMRERYGGEFAESGIYCKIQRKIIAEEFIETKDGLPPADYKFFCQYGKCRLLFVACDRYDDNTKFDYYTPDWEWIPVLNSHPNNGPIKRPNNLDEMIGYAEKLSSRFPLVRIDLYNNEGRIVFGEITFTHFGCHHRFSPDRYDYEFGSLFEVGKEKGILK